MTRRIGELLNELMRWEREAGIGHAALPDRKSTGESTAFIERLKRELAEAGAIYHWDSRRRRYVLDGVEPGAKGGELTAPEYEGDGRERDD